MHDTELANSAQALASKKGKASNADVQSDTIRQRRPHCACATTPRGVKPSPDWPPSHRHAHQMSRTPSPSLARYGQGTSAAGRSQSDLDAAAASESARQSPVQMQHQDRRYHATNTLYRSPSAASGTYVEATSHGAAVDSEIAQGLAEDVPSHTRSESRISGNDEDTGTFLPAREAGRAGVTGSILPPAAFFSPKRPPQSVSPSALMSASGLPAESHYSQQMPFVVTSTDSEQTQSNTVPRKTSTSTIAASNRPAQTIRMQQFAPHRPAMQRPSPNSAATTTATNGLRGYKNHRGANRFFAFGLIMTSDDNPLPFLASLVVMIALPVLWLIFVAPYTWRHVSPAPVILFAYLFAVALTSMCVTAWRDPGVLPRELDPDPPCTAGVDGGYVDTSDPLAIPLPRIVRVRNHVDLKVKWCDTCGTYRPPRSSHCRVCDNCVENIDHHCTFLNTCIGRRNYFTFFAFLVFSIVGCLLAFVFCVLHIYYLTQSPQTTLPRGGVGEGKSVREALQAAPLSAVLFFLFLGVVAPISVLFSYHVRLVCFNRTTVEQIRINATHSYSEKPSYDDEERGREQAAPPGRMHQRFAACLPCLDLGIAGRDPNPFAHRSMLRNASAALLRPMTADSWIDRYRPTRHDDRRPNPASLDTPVAIVA